MKYSTACSLLEISEKDAETLSKVNKQYRKMCLKYHPDKNGNVDTNDMFLHVKEAYDILLKNAEDKDDVEECDKDLDSECEKVFPHPPTVHAWMERLKPILQVMVSGLKASNLKIHEDVVRMSLGHITESSGWSQIIQFLANASENNTMHMLEKMDKDMLSEVYHFLCKHRRRFPTAMDGLIHYIGSLVNSSLHTRAQRDRYVVMHPKLEDLFECNVYKYVEGEKTYIIPTWMEESIFDWSDSEIRDSSNNMDQSQPSGEFIVHCIPVCPEGAWIDENHNVHVNVEWKLKDVWDSPDDGALIVEFLGKNYAVYKRVITMMKQQQYTIYGKGIPRGNSKDVFDVSKKGDIILHITILHP